ncbi:hypothetical protein CKM354_001272000 [Cercospora kikuchii]|uniref:Uncharacterized protein n=1 Tax=Cercospora kikuchii TaxID=84275 RepID=A0A9P3L266_9PEZI|nr:uncharacterized protein CKM354_001272000 [Cercospora kikuchii]GIZ49693.1 hypothetical protein CKM354_001272000 [Cercospora kikuchii]
MDYQYEDVYVGEPLDTARATNNVITQPDCTLQKKLHDQRRTSEPQQALNWRRKKSKSQQGTASDPLRETRILRLVKRLARENRALQTEVERFAHENQALRADVNERGETIEMLQEGLKRLSGEAVALVQNGGLAHGRGSLVRDQPSVARSVSESPVSAPHLDNAEQSEVSPDISHNGHPICHREHGEPDVKQELDEGGDAIDAGRLNDHDRYDQEHHEYGSATEQEFEGFEDGCQNEELHRHCEDAQRGDSDWQTEHEGSVDVDEERDTEDGPSHQVQERLNYNIDDIGIVVEEEDNDFALVTGILPEALEPILEELFNETFPAEMEVRKEKDSRRLLPRKKAFRKHWNDHAKNTSACVKQFLKANRTTYAIDDKAYIACRTCFRAQLPCIRWSAAAKQFYVCLLPKVSRSGGEFDEAWDYIYPEKNMSAELEDEHGVLWTGK